MSTHTPMGPAKTPPDLDSYNKLHITVRRTCPFCKRKKEIIRDAFLLRLTYFLIWRVFREGTWEIPNENNANHSLLFELFVCLMYWRVI